MIGAHLLYGCVYLRPALLQRRVDDVNELLVWPAAVELEVALDVKAVLVNHHVLLLPTGGILVQVVHPSVVGVGDAACTHF